MFKKPTKNRKNVRKRKPSNEDDLEVEAAETKVIELAKLRRELTKKSAGVSATTLAKGVRVTKEEEVNDDPFKMKTGGLTTAKDRERDRNLLRLRRE